MSQEHIGCGFRRVEELLTGGLIPYPTRSEDPADLVVTFVRPQSARPDRGVGTGGIRLDGDELDAMFAIVTPMTSRGCHRSPTPGGRRRAEEGRRTLLRLTRYVDQPIHAEFVGAHAKCVAPDGLLQGHRCHATTRQLFEIATQQTLVIPT